MAARSIASPLIIAKAPPGASKIPSLEVAGVIETGDEAVMKAINSGAFVMGPEVRAFEAQCADYFGAKHAIANVVLALVDPGDEVLIPGPARG